MSNDFNNKSLTDKKMAILSSMSSGYASSIQNQISKSCTIHNFQESEIQINCDPPEPSPTPPVCSIIKSLGVCGNCINQFYPLQTSSCDKIKNDYSIWNQYRDGICKELCTCSMSNVNIDDFLSVDQTCIIDPNKIDISDIVKNIKSNLDQLTGQKLDDDDITNIVKKVNVQISQQVTQSIYNAQVVEINGYGNMSGITVKDTENVVMSALAQISDSMSFIDSVVDTAIQNIKKDVDKDVSMTFLQVVKANENYFIFVGIILILAIILIIFLLVLRAWKKNKK